MADTVLPIVESDLLPPHFGPKSDHFFLKNQTKNDLKSDLFPQKQDIGVKNAAQVPQNSIKLNKLVTIISTILSLAQLSPSLLFF